MNKLYMGIDIGKRIIKGIIIDGYDNIITSTYIDNYKDVVMGVKCLIKKLKSDTNLSCYQVVSVGVTGNSRKLIGTLLDSSVIKNEIVALVKGICKIHTDVGTIIEVGEEDYKLILLDRGIVKDYKIDTCESEFTRTLMRKGEGPIVVTGNVNKKIIKYWEEVLHEKIMVSKNANYVGALGIALMARESKKEKVFDFYIDEDTIEAKMVNCLECSCKCNIVKIYKNNKLIDCWGSKCNIS